MSRRGKGKEKGISNLIIWEQDIKGMIWGAHIPRALCWLKEERKKEEGRRDDIGEGEKPVEE